MRLKGSAVGVKNIPMNERCYFLVYLPTTISNKHIGPSKSIYVNINWTIGKAIDSIADILKISNYVLFIRVVGDEAISVYPSASFNVKFQSIINEGDINISCIFCVRANIFIIVNTVEKEFEQTLI